MTSRAMIVGLAFAGRKAGERPCQRFVSASLRRSSFLAFSGLLHRRRPNEMPLKQILHLGVGYRGRIQRLSALAVLVRGFPVTKD
jgi:hypothetical protein